eukprot:TRINITY_DN6797_c0_g3_i1.p1 TRINITY_DN6797_c0_g3~~TRINITY_DN6797_c0_g3_i1.p1  ORF type:complete len:137 (+),score=5.07 TRINITY_DN6797_c0_g3_i1:1464-1874(+)
MNKHRQDDATGRAWHPFTAEGRWSPWHKPQASGMELTYWHGSWLLIALKHSSGSELYCNCSHWLMLNLNTGITSYGPSPALSDAQLSGRPVEVELEFVRPPCHPFMVFSGDPGCDIITGARIKCARLINGCAVKCT